MVIFIELKAAAHVSLFSAPLFSLVSSGLCGDRRLLRLPLTFSSRTSSDVDMCLAKITETLSAGKFPLHLSEINLTSFSDYGNIPLEVGALWEIPNHHRDRFSSENVSPTHGKKDQLNHSSCTHSSLENLLGTRFYHDDFTTKAQNIQSSKVTSNLPASWYDCGTIS